MSYNRAPPPLRDPPPKRQSLGNSLGLNDREVILIAAWAATGMPVDAIAARLGVTPGAVRTTLERVLRPRIT